MTTNGIPRRVSLVPIPTTSTATMTDGRITWYVRGQRWDQPTCSFTAGSTRWPVVCWARR